YCGRYFSRRVDVCICSVEYDHRPEYAVSITQTFVFTHPAFGHDISRNLRFGAYSGTSTTDMAALAQLLNSGLDIMVGSVLQMVFTMVLIVTMNVPSGLLMAELLVPATMLTVWFQKRSSVIYRQIRTNAARLIAHFVETVTGIRAVKSYRRQRANGARYEQLVEDHR